MTMIRRWRPYWRDLLASPTGRRSAGDHHDDTVDLDRDDDQDDDGLDVDDVDNDNADVQGFNQVIIMMTVEIWMKMTMTKLKALMLLITIFRDSTSVSESTGGLASNDSLDHLRSSAEPVRM